MSDEATKAMLGVYAGVGLVPAHELRLLAGEIDRLRALVKAVEWPGVGDGNHVCQFCDAGFYETSISRPNHQPDCPAFWPDGRVR